MLIDEIINFANNLYKDRVTCQHCNHPDCCPKDCKICLRQVHFPDEYFNGKIDYDCPNMISNYCRLYLYKYASEIYRLLQKSEIAGQLENYRVLSLGCGASPDLMAFEKFALDKGNKEIQYCGFDKNPLWQSVQNAIKEYRNPSLDIKINYDVHDVVELFVNRPVLKANVLVLQYVISYFYNTQQISNIREFFDNLIDKVIMQRKIGEPFIILITDVNSCYRGRDYFGVFFNRIKQKGLTAQSKPFHFLPCNYAYGEAHESNNIVFTLPPNMQSDLDVWKTCSGAQLLIEVD